MFTPKRWRKRREWTEPVTADAPLEEDEVEIILELPTFLSVLSELTCDDLIALSDEIDYETEMKEERAENRVDGLKAHKANLYGRCI